MYPACYKRPIRFAPAQRGGHCSNSLPFLLQACVQLTMFNRLLMDILLQSPVIISSSKQREFSSKMENVRYGFINIQQIIHDCHDRSSLGEAC